MAGRDDKTVRLKVVIDDDSRGATKAAKATAEVRKESDKLQDSLKETSRESAKLGHEQEHLGDSLRHTADDTRTLDEEIAELKVHIKELGLEYDRTADKSLFKDISKDRSAIRNLERIKKDLEDVGEAAAGAAVKGGGLLGKLVGSLGDVGAGGPLKVALIATAAVAVAEVTPMIAAAVSGAVVGLVGAGGIIGGLVAASKNSGVHEAIENFKQTISQEWGDVGDTFVEPFHEALRIVGQGFQDLHLDDVFAALAPSVTTLAKGLIGMARNIMPGLSVAFQRSGPFIEALADGLEEMGGALGQFFRDLSASEGAVQGLREGIGFLNRVIVNAGFILHGLSDIFSDLNMAWANFWQGVSSASRTLGFDFLADGFARIANNLAFFNREADGTVNAFSPVTVAVRDTAKEAQNLAEALRKANEQYEAFFSRSMDVDEARLAVQKGLVALREELSHGRVDWSSTTEEGLKHRQMLLDQVDALNRQRQAAIDASDGSETAIGKINRAYDASILKLQLMAKGAGATKGVLEDLAGTYTITFYLNQLAGKQVMAWSDLRNRERHSEAPLSIPVSVYGGKRAAGGPVVAGRTYLVGEHGPEPFTPSSNGIISPNSSLAPQRLYVELGWKPGAESGAMYALGELMRQFVTATAGGNVQMALGR